MTTSLCITEFIFFRGNISFFKALVGIVIMMSASLLATYPIFHFSGISTVMSLQSVPPLDVGSTVHIKVCHEIWPKGVRLSYQIGFSIGHILLPSLFIVSTIYCSPLFTFVFIQG